MKQKKNNDLKTLAIILLFLLLLFLSFKASRMIKDLEQSQGSIVAQLTDSLETYQRKDSAWVAERKAIVANVGTLKTLIYSKDSMIAVLAKKVNNHTPVVIGHQTETTIDIVGVPTIDTTKNNSLPTYHYTFKDRWQYGSIDAAPDRMHLRFTSINEFHYTVEWKKTGWFKPRIAYVEATNLNPRTITTNVQGLVIQPPKASVKEKVTASGILIGIGFALGLMIK
jgi:hypothetical protein